METEINFYERFVPSLQRLRCPLPNFFPLVHSDYESLNREILLLGDLRRTGYDAQAAEADGIRGLDLAHVVHAVEWLAKLHALSYVILNTYEKGKVDGWLQDNSWIRNQDEDRRDAILREERLSKQKESGDEVDSAVVPDGETDSTVKSRLTQMAVEAIKVNFIPVRINYSQMNFSQKLTEATRRWRRCCRGRTGWTP